MATLATPIGLRTISNIHLFVQAENINVPVLYSHGVMDPRVDISETEIMVKTLRKNGIKAPFIRMLNEGHGWRKLENQMFYAQKEAAFLKQVLHLNSEQ